MVLKIFKNYFRLRILESIQWRERVVHQNWFWPIQRNTIIKILVPFISAVDELSIDIWPFGSGPVKFLLRCLLQGLTSNGQSNGQKLLWNENIDQFYFGSLIRLIEKSSKVASNRIIWATVTLFSQKSKMIASIISIKTKALNCIA